MKKRNEKPLSRTRFYANLKNKGIGKKILHGAEYFVGLGWRNDGFVEVNNTKELPFK